MNYISLNAYFVEAHLFLPTRLCAIAISAMSLCLSVRLSQTGIVSKRLTDRAYFRHRGYTISLSYIVLKGNSGISKNKDTSLLNFIPNPGL